MRCERALELLTARMDGEISPWRARRLDRHLAGCAGCAQELDSTARLFAALGGLQQTAAVPDRLERDTLRAVRELAGAEAERRATRGWRAWFEVALPIASAATVLLLAIRVTTGPLGETSGPPISGTAVRVAANGAAPTTGSSGSRRAGGSRTNRRRAPVPATAPPPELAAAPDLFIELPILRRLEKLQHFESIRTTRKPPAPPTDPAASNG
jgi:anti-sigma factor RsiW